MSGYLLGDSSERVKEFGSRLLSRHPGAGGCQEIGCIAAVRACMSLEAPMSDHWGRPGGRCVPRTSVTVILFEERPPALSVEAEEYPRARKEPAYKPGRRWCRVGGPERMVKQVRLRCPVTRSSVSMSRPARWWRSASG